MYLQVKKFNAQGRDSGTVIAGAQKMPSDMLVVDFYSVQGDVAAQLAMSDADAERLIKVLQISRKRSDLGEMLMANSDEIEASYA